MSKHLEYYSALTRLVEGCPQGDPTLVAHLRSKFSDPRLDIRQISVGEGAAAAKKWVVLRWVDAKQVFRRSWNEECANFKYPMTIFVANKDRIGWADVDRLQWLPDHKERAKELDDQAWKEEQDEVKANQELKYAFGEARTMGMDAPTVGPAMNDVHVPATKSPHGYYIIDRRTAGAGDGNNSP